MADVFVSYAREDQEFVLKLAATLKERGVPVWLDQWDIPPGTDWDQTIDNAIYDCAHFLIVLSPAAVKSQEVRSELRTALDENKLIVPVLYRTCRIPRRLRLIQRVDFTSSGPDDEALLGQVLRALTMPESPPFKPEVELSTMDCWSQIRALESKPLRTLARRRPFEIVVVAENRVRLKVVSTGKMRTVRRKEIEGAFRKLALTGEINRSEIEERHSSRNIAYVAAILAELDGVTYQVGPIRLFYRSE